MPQIYGEPLSVMKFANSSLEFDKAKLDSLLLHPEVKDRKVVVLSIVGAFRKGKSFFLDYCLRFLYGNVSLYDTLLIENLLYNTNQLLHSTNLLKTPIIL